MHRSAEPSRGLRQPDVAVATLGAWLITKLCWKSGLSLGAGARPGVNRQKEGWGQAPPGLCCQRSHMTQTSQPACAGQDGVCRNTCQLPCHTRASVACRLRAAFGGLLGSWHQQELCAQLCCCCARQGCQGLQLPLPKLALWRVSATLPRRLTQVRPTKRVLWL